MSTRRLDVNHSCVRRRRDLVTSPLTLPGLPHHKCKVQVAGRVRACASLSQPGRAIHDSWPSGHCNNYHYQLRELRGCRLLSLAASLKTVDGTEAKHSRAAAAPAPGSLSPRKTLLKVGIGAPTNAGPHKMPFACLDLGPTKDFCGLLGLSCARFLSPSWEMDQLIDCICRLRLPWAMTLRGSLSPALGSDRGGQASSRILTRTALEVGLGSCVGQCLAAEPPRWHTSACH